MIGHKHHLLDCAALYNLLKNLAFHAVVPSYILDYHHMVQMTYIMCLYNI